ncbi:spermatogenesis-associated protein 24-like [Mizuhopecten yessoensis]|uniref:Spermatogenesis-associated protein 24 n=1 Tax=Mizuhopecten yessoensis TaxID=6573 RepID=A0A210PP51_MIZYE|nr:spermatogenesis-associated protein 24-like [Mizuhopecten yessoensis]OWF38275.1 Spermatogenesis-associated protein 24 [Mizuhopecten yessoensis]
MAERDAGSNQEDDRIPTSVLVQNQMKDLIGLQDLTINKLQQDITLQESTLRESFLPREVYDSELQQFEKTIHEDYVPREKYDKLQAEVEQQKLSHIQTQGELYEVKDKLEFALGEVEVLTKQLQREKAAFEKAFGSLQKKAVEETSKTTRLTDKCSEITEEVQKKDDELNSKELEIQQLEKKLKQQQMSYKKKLGDAEIQRKQDQYIAKLLDKQDKNTGYVEFQRPKSSSTKAKTGSINTWR